ncbi:hypothetical protein PZ895_16220 [Mesorhizobium sp. YIM 152430]|uniref:hypothetical protein n=1 Tax=Mesorhizobium sp. YIM 152430 TaxID=3031761 RepID=UPI0023D9EC86|nr:hypothetical protein [Mesorhizobium sp. YIM 152430]MDF1601308.1 hypothetical protein [Mesorhizobium sp. YIM 152430]
MSSVEFRQFAASAAQSTKSDRLLRAAVSAFCSILRPSRQEVAQIEDLATPLLAHASRETLRYVAAALSECLNPPATLVRRLCAEPVDVCAPLLVRSSALRDIDLLALIGRHGLGHALAIERRRDLDPRIANLIASLKSRSVNEEAASPAPTSLLPATLDRLRAMMAPAAETRTARWTEAPTPYLKLRAAALTGNPSIVRATLASLLGIDEHAAAGLLADPVMTTLSAALKRLGLSAEEAYLIASATHPHRFAKPAAIRAFVEDYLADTARSASVTRLGSAKP